jgi:hypothetical protein
MMRQELLRRAHHHVFFEVNAKAALKIMQSHSLDCLILNLDRFSHPQVRLIEQIRALKHRFQVLVFADEVSVSATELIKGTPGVLIFGKAFLNLEKDFLGLCLRFLRGEKAPRRDSARHPTFQRASVENLRTGRKFVGLASNMSRTGGFIQFTNGILSVGDKVILTINLPSVSRVHEIQAQAVWVRSSASGKRSAGLKFIKKEKTPAP